MTNPNPPRNEHYCCYRLQAEKRISRGESQSRLETCIKNCSGYNNRCENYTPLKVYREKYL